MAKEHSLIKILDSRHLTTCLAIIKVSPLPYYILEMVPFPFWQANQTVTVNSRTGYGVGETEICNHILFDAYFAKQVLKKPFTSFVE